MNDTTRRFPRTMAEAFPHEVRNAYAIEHHVPIGERFGGVLLACAIGVGLALALAHWWSA